MSLREVVMFPKSIVPLFVGRESSIKAIETALEKYDKADFLVAQKDPSQEHPRWRTYEGWNRQQSSADVASA